MSARRITPSRILVSTPRWMTTSYWSAAKELPISSKRQTKRRLKEIFIHNLRWFSRVPRQNHAGCYQSESVVNGWGIPDHSALHFRALHGTVAPFTGLEGRVSLFLSSTWGRADQQTSRDSN